MNNQSFDRLPGMRWTALSAALGAVLVLVTACATGMSSPSSAAMQSALSNLPLTPPSPDPRIGLTRARALLARVLKKLHGIYI